MLLLQADVLELKANPNAEASGPIIESRLDVGRGPVATMLVQRGTLHAGDAIVAGDAWGKVRAMLDENGERVEGGRPGGRRSRSSASTSRRPPARSAASSSPSATRARWRRSAPQRLRTEGLMRRSKSVSLEDLFDRMQEGALQELNLIIKARRAGLRRGGRQPELQKLKHDEVAVQRHPHRRRRDHRERRHARGRVQGDRGRLQRAAERRGAGARRARGRRHPHLPRHLPADRGHRAGARRHADADSESRSVTRRGRGARALQGLPARHDRGLHGHERRDPALRPRAR